MIRQQNLAYWLLIWSKHRILSFNWIIWNTYLVNDWQILFHLFWIIWRFKCCQNYLQLSSSSYSLAQLSLFTFNLPPKHKYKLWLLNKLNFKVYLKICLPMWPLWRNRSKDQVILTKRSYYLRTLSSQKEKVCLNFPKLSFLHSTFQSKAVRRWPINKRLNSLNSFKRQELKSTIWKIWQKRCPNVMRWIRSKEILQNNCFSWTVLNQSSTPTVPWM